MLGALVVALVVCVALLAREALAARDALTEAAEMLPAAEDAVRSGDVDAARDVLDDLAPLTTTARENTDGPLWAAAAHTPGVGADVSAVSTTAASVDTLVQDVLPPLAQVAQVLAGDGLRPVDGAIDLAPVTDAAPVVHEASTAIDGVVADLGAIDTSALLPVVAGPVDDLRDRTVDLASVVATGERFVDLVPPLLGADGPRTYLLLNLNSAELRAAGGIPGAVAEIHADGGRITLGRQVPSNVFGPYAEPVLPLAPEDEHLYTDRMGRFVQDTVLTPDFPTAAATTAEMWRQSLGGDVDGVLATDPVALSYLLEATGPITSDGIEVTAENAVELLLSEVYATFGTPEETDAFFASVSAAVFGRALDGSVGAGDVQAAFLRAAEEHRLLLWSAHEDEQDVLEDTLLSGAIDTAARADASLGVFVNDAVSGKLTYYLDTESEIVATRCTPEGSVHTVRTVLTSRVPDDAATSLPGYVLGTSPDADPVMIRVNLVLYPSRGGTLTDITRDGESTGGQTAEVGGRRATEIPISLAPGASTTVDVDMRGGPAATDGDAAADDDSSTIDLWTTPTATSSGLAVQAVPAC
ncbi:hypothetical protein GCM10025865_18750 [Paraoerskovia sediminicola]|uniref:DUF4012 domain-containing protein n=1 Tax=Paraoerskovia sediminicola TaxID=1138587 RepID=A0ABM8G3G3_9CELL|nr:hypothetical protein GCM10025865_18750 [Paraoerskovia sediminicola]